MAGRVVVIHDGRLLVDSDMDRLQENYSLALVPDANGTLMRKLGQHGSCVAVRGRSDALHAVIALDPRSAAQLLETQFGVSGANCRSVALEEMFIEMVEGQA